MRAIQVSRPNGPLELVERDLPEAGRGEARVKVQACGICHSDSFVKEGTFPGITYPRVPGHERRPKIWPSRPMKTTSNTPSRGLSGPVLQDQ